MVAMPEIEITTEYGTKNKLMKRTGEFNYEEQQFYFYKRNY